MVLIIDIKHGFSIYHHDHSLGNLNKAYKFDYNLIEDFALSYIRVASSFLLHLFKKTMIGLVAACARKF